MNGLPCRNHFVMFLAAMILFAAECHAGSNYVTITLTEEVLRQSIQSILPIEINTQKDLVQGKLFLDSIDRFKLGENSAQVRGVILGKDLVLSTRIGEQDIRLKVGEVQFPLTCDFTFRFAPKEKKLYIAPHIVDPSKSESQAQVNKVLPILALLNNREYPVSLSSLQSLQTKIGQQKLSVAMELLDVQVSTSKLVLKMVPKLSKID